MTIPVSDLLLRTASSQHVKPSAACTARVFINDAFYIVEFVVLSHASHDVILGWDFLSAHHAVVDCARAQLALSPLGTTVPDSPSPSPKLVVAAEVVISPFSAALVSVSCDSVCDSSALFTPSEDCARRRNLVLPFAVVTLANGAGAVYACNPFPCSSTLLQGECIGRLDTFDAIFPLDAPYNMAALPINAVTSATASASPDQDAFLRSIDNALTQAQRTKVVQLLERFRGSFDVGQ